MRDFLPAAPRAVRNATELALRVAMGLAFVLHGWPKIQAPTSWAGPGSAIPEALQALAAVAEFGGGMALVLGLLTRWAGLGLLATMSYAVFTHVQQGQPFVGRGASFELPLMYAVLAAWFAAHGAGPWSLDARLGGARGRRS